MNTPEHRWSKHPFRASLRCTCGATAADSPWGIGELRGRAECLPSDCVSAFDRFLRVRQ